MTSGVVFITGVGRSGTTVLQSMLHSHSAFHFSPETHFFKRYILPFQLKKKTPSVQDLSQDTYLNRLSESQRESLFKMKMDSIDELKSAFQAIMSGGESASFSGDKDTEYVRYFPHLKRLFPDAYMIHIVRDPRDVVASRLKTEWGAKRSLEFHIAEYQYYLKKVRAEGPALFGDRFIELKYEDLLEAPEEQLSSILSKFGETFEPQMLEFYKNDSGLVAEDEKKWKGNVSKPLQQKNSGKWKASFSPKEAALIQKGIKSFFQEMNYELVDVKPSPAKRLKVRVLKKLFAGKTLKEQLK
ncbi:MAG: sulfotransferase [Flavobacteriia bacterium]|nr:sulfotransferase [Flavobacteriia bacterium]